MLGVPPGRLLLGAAPPTDAADPAAVGALLTGTESGLRQAEISRVLQWPRSRTAAAITGLAAQLEPVGQVLIRRTNGTLSIGPANAALDAEQTRRAAGTLSVRRMRAPEPALLAAALKAGGKLAAYDGMGGERRSAQASLIKQGLVRIDKGTIALTADAAFSLAID